MFVRPVPRYDTLRGVRASLRPLVSLSAESLGENNLGVKKQEPLSR